MKKVCLSFCFFSILIQLSAQGVNAKLAAAMKTLESDPQMENAIAAFYVVDIKSGAEIYNRNGKTGLAPASTQKIITSATALELLGPSFNYTTTWGYSGAVEAGHLKGNLYLIPSGDPTLGSWRWNTTHSDSVISALESGLKNAQIVSIDQSEIIVAKGDFREELYPTGWIWQDIGNYYGAYHSSLNWRENQFDILFRTGNSIGSPVSVNVFNPGYVGYSVNTSLLSTAAKGSGDNAYVFLNPNVPGVLDVQGTLPAGEQKFSISASHPDPFQYFNDFLHNDFNSKSTLSSLFTGPVILTKAKSKTPAITTLATIQSPSLDSINYWFMKKSINLYGEALIRTLGLRKGKEGSTEQGIEVIKDFWSRNGIKASAIQIADGSGLSPQNRITAQSLVTILKFAKSRSWFPVFYQSLPEINGIRMKSGSISGSRAYAGYHTSKSGQQYAFAIIVNNYHGSASAIVRKMWTVLDHLK